ncbi:hypothetical protein VZP09_00800, partial [Klebsiella sp. EMBS2024]
AQGSWRPARYAALALA